MIFGLGTGNGPAGPKIASYLVPPHHMWSYPAHALQCAKPNSSQTSSRRVVMSGEQEDDLVDKACVYLLESRYPDCCSGNTKRIIQRKATTLATRGGEVFYKKAREGLCWKEGIIFKLASILCHTVIQSSYSPLSSVLLLLL